MGPDQRLVIEGNFETEKEQTDTQRGRPCTDRRKDWRDTAASQGRLRMASKHQQLEAAKKDSSLKPPEGRGPCWHLNFKLLASQTVIGKNSSVVLSHLLCGTLLWHPYEINTGGQSMPSAMLAESAPCWALQQGRGLPWASETSSLLLCSCRERNIERVHIVEVYIVWFLILIFKEVIHYIH